ncbi:MAG: hypothetical protein JST40_06965 [Armatimonadetes bacterium]|nr:hypothetical protein [Armatimonadota bacterium]
MSRLNWGGLVVLASLMAGCGGNTNSASPFSNTTYSGRDPSNLAPTRSSAFASGGTLPVFLSIGSDQLPHDLWVTLKSVEVQGTQSSQAVFSSKSGYAFRLASLRDTNGPRYLYLGTIEKKEPLARAKVVVGDQAFWQELGQQEIMKSKWSGTEADGGEGVVLNTNLDPNAEFQDALVLNLSLKVESEKLTPAIGLGSAGGALDLARQEAQVLSGKIEKVEAAEGGTWVSLGKHRIAVPAEVVAGEALKKDTELAVLLAYDKVARTPVAVATQDWSEGLLRAKLANYDAGRGSISLEPLAGAWKELNVMTLPVVQGNKDALAKLAVGSYVLASIKSQPDGPAFEVVPAQSVTVPSAMAAKATPAKAAIAKPAEDKASLKEKQAAHRKAAKIKS